MTPTVREVLQGCAVAIARPMPPEAGPDYAASRIGMVSTLIVLAAQEAERAVGATIAENAAIRRLFADMAGYDAALGGRLAAAASEVDAELDAPSLDCVNARLRGLLIELHEAVEAAEDKAADARILALYQTMAVGRRLAMPG